MLQAVRPKDHNTAGRILSMNNSSDTIGNRTRDRSDCSAILQPTAPSHAPYFISTHRKVQWWEVRICWGPWCWCEYLSWRYYHACAWLMRRRMCACLLKTAIHKVQIWRLCLSSHSSYFISKLCSSFSMILYLNFQSVPLTWNYV
jgi:hypothetical protein